MDKDSSNRNLVITATCSDRVGLIHLISGVLTSRQWNIDDSQQFADSNTGLFFMRVEASRATDEREVIALRDEFEMVGTSNDIAISIHDRATTPSILILVSRLGHCLNDLLYRQQTGALQAHVAGVVSNHLDLEALAKAYEVPFHHLPVDNSNRVEQEASILALADQFEVDLVILARYMQILSPEMVDRLDGRAINIHHSFLPSFKGASPYRQAYSRGVKLIGATAHYVTGDLDEGPIIEQEVTRVDHHMTPDRLAAIGQDVECSALARAVTWHLEHRVFLDASRTVVFR